MQAVAAQDPRTHHIADYQTDVDAWKSAGYPAMVRIHYGTKALPLALRVTSPALSLR